MLSTKEQGRLCYKIFNKQIKLNLITTLEKSGNEGSLVAMLVN